MRQRYTSRRQNWRAPYSRASMDEIAAATGARLAANTPPRPDSTRPILSEEVSCVGEVIE